MSGFTIKDLENFSGIKAHTIRVWEQRYGFLKPQRTDTNIRYYTNEELKTVLNVALLNKFGFRLCHIDGMKPDEICAKVLSLGNAEAIPERVVNQLIREMIDFEADRFGATLDSYIGENGLEKTIKEIIFPFLQKIGILWQTGNILAAQEHFVSNIIRQKLIVAIDSARPSQKIDKSVLLFLPEKEHHELGLLFLYYLLKAKGAKVTYLGANVPITDVEEVAKMIKPDIAFIHLSSYCSACNFEKLLSNFPESLHNLALIVSGCPVHKQTGKAPSNICFKQSFSEVAEFISSLS